MIGFLFNFFNPSGSLVGKGLDGAECWKHESVKAGGIAQFLQ